MIPESNESCSSAGQARKKREAEAQAEADPTFRTVPRNLSPRAMERHKGAGRIAILCQVRLGVRSGSNAEAGDPGGNWMSRKAWPEPEPPRAQ